MSSTNGEEPPSKKKKKPSTKPNSISSLPDDLIVSCLARVSRLHYPILSLVSKSFRSLLASPEIYQTRSLLNRTEKCLYVCLQFPSETNPRWFTLCKKPNQTITKKKTKRKKKEISSGYALAPIRILNSPTVEWTNLIAVDSNLYAIKATEEEESPPCYNIPFLDCRTHSWLESPSMRIAVLGKLYLPGNRENLDSSLLNCIEVFNTETQTWYYPVHPDKWLPELENMEGTVYMRKSAQMWAAYNLKESRLEAIMDDNFGRVRVCMLEDINCAYDYINGFQCTVGDSDVWRKIKGLEGLPKFAKYSNVRLVVYGGGKMIVLWDKYLRKRGGYKKKMIWCAEISFEKRNNGEEIWGKVEWVDAVLRVPKSYKFVYAVAATV